MLHRIVQSVRWRVNNAWKAKLFPSHLKTPVATFTFDDFPRSAWLTGGEILEKHRVKGTYFVSGVFAPLNLRKNSTTDTIADVEYYTPEDLKAAYEHGHEIGCHTFDHSNVTHQTRAQLLDNLARNDQFVRDALGDVRMTSFAFPRGEASIRAKNLLSKHFAVCRGSWPGINSGLIDLSQLKCYGIDQQMQRFSLQNIVSQARKSNGWLVFNTHDVTNNPSPYGCTPEQLDVVLKTVLDAGFLVLPMKSALGRVAFTV